MGYQGNSRGGGQKRRGDFGHGGSSRGRGGSFRGNKSRNEGFKSHRSNDSQGGYRTDYQNSYPESNEYDAQQYPPQGGFDPNQAYYDQSNGYDPNQGIPVDSPHDSRALVLPPPNSAPQDGYYPPFDPNNPNAQYYDYGQPPPPPNQEYIQDPNALQQYQGYQYDGGASQGSSVVPPNQDPNAPAAPPIQHNPSIPGGPPGSANGQLQNDVSQSTKSSVSGAIPNDGYVSNDPNQLYYQANPENDTLSTSYEKLKQKHKQLRDNYENLNVKYTKLKDVLKQERENFENKKKKLIDDNKKLQITLSKLENGQNASVDTIKYTESDAGESITNEVENPKYNNKDQYDLKESSFNALKAERDVYKRDKLKLTHDVKVLQTDKTKAYEKVTVAENELNSFKIKYISLENEKQQLLDKLEKLQNEEKNSVQSPIDDVITSPHYDSNGEELANEDVNDKRSLWKRKEYYKAKYQNLLEEKDKEQQNFLAVNKRLLEKFVFGETK